MEILAGVFGAAIIFIVLWDAFETIVLPRRVPRRVRLTRLFYRSTWRPWSALARLLSPGKRRETYLSFYGPLSLLLLLSVWAAGLIVGFAIMHWALGSAINVVDRSANFGTDLYLSGTTFFTLGLGDVIPRTPFSRALTVIEAGMGFGFLALVIGYLPVLYQSFSRRELNITLLDARAGSPPSAEELLRGFGADHEELTVLLAEWERWGAEVLESHLSYPVLSYYRSQHDNQSWLAALTTVLDASALVMVGIEGACARQASLTFAMARHAVADLAQVLGRPPVGSAPDRLPSSELGRLRTGLAAAGIVLHAGDGAEDKLAELRRMYEPYVAALARYLLMPLPAWRAGAEPHENWRTSAWGRRPGGASGPSVDPHDD